MRWPIIWTDNLPDKVGGQARGPVILLRNKYKSPFDEGLYRHELEHVKQWFFTLGLHGFLYKLSRKYRLWSEVRAYAVQMRYKDKDGGNLSLDDAAWKLTRNRYSLNISIETAKDLLIEENLDHYF